METKIKVEFVKWLNEEEQLALMTLPTEFGAFSPIPLFGEDRESFLVCSFKYKESSLVVFNYAGKEISFIPILSEEQRKANPQLEDGFLRIALELVEVLAKVNFSPYETRTLWALWRKTWGWGKKEDRISITQFQELTGLDRRHQVRTLSGLIKKRIIARRGNGYILTYGFQKDYTKWIAFTGNSFPTKQRNQKTSLKSIASIDNDSFIEQTNQKTFSKSIASTGNSLKSSVIVASKQRKSLPLEAPTIDKQYIKENNSPNFSEDSDAFILSSLLLEKIKERDPCFKEPNIQRWATHIDRLIRIDKRTSEEIRQVIEWCQADDFWKNNIFSTQKLREQFNQLALKMPKGEESTKREPTRRVDKDGIIEIKGEDETWRKTNLPNW